MWLSAKYRWSCLGGVLGQLFLTSSFWLAFFDQFFWPVFNSFIWPYGQLFFQIRKISIFSILIRYLYPVFSWFIWPSDQFSRIYPWLVAPKPRISARWVARNSLIACAAHECWVQQFNRIPGSSVLLMKTSWTNNQSLSSSVVMTQSESSASSS